MCVKKHAGVKTHHQRLRDQRQLMRRSSVAHVCMYALSSIYIHTYIARRGGRDGVLEDRRVSRGRPVKVHQSLAGSQRREEPYDGNAL